MQYCNGEGLYSQRTARARGDQFGNAVNQYELAERAGLGQVFTIVVPATSRSMRQWLLAMLFSVLGYSRAQPLLELPNDFAFTRAKVNAVGAAPYGARLRELKLAGRLDTDPALKARLQRILFWPPEAAVMVFAEHRREYATATRPPSSRPSGSVGNAREIAGGLRGVNVARTGQGSVERTGP